MVEEALTSAKVVDRKVTDLSERYQLGDMLGEGRFSQVFAATRGRHKVALKAMEISLLEQEDEVHTPRHERATPRAFVTRETRTNPPSRPTSPTAPQRWRGRLSRR